MHPFNQRNTLVRNSVINASGSAAAGGGPDNRMNSGMVTINPDCDCPKCRRAARARNMGNGGAGAGAGAGNGITRRDEARTLAMGSSRGRAKSPLAFKTKFHPSKTNPNYDDEDGAVEADGDNGSGREMAPRQTATGNESTTKFVLTPRKMVYTPPPQPKQQQQQQQTTGRSGNGDCRHVEKGLCCVYCRAKLETNGLASQKSWIPTPSPRIPDRKRTAVISKLRALQPVYSAPTCTCFHDDVEEETPRFQEDNADLEEQEQYDDENDHENEELETVIKPQPRPRQENPIRTRFRQLQQQEARIRRVPIPSRYMTDLQTRIEKSINIYVYRNGIESLPPALIHIPPSRKQNMRAVMSVIQDRMKYPIGYAKTLYKIDGTLVRHPCELELYEKYVVASSYQKGFKPVEYGRVRSPLMILGSDSKNIHVRSKRNSYEDWKKKWKQTGLGKCPLPADEARSREVLEKPHSLKTCIPVKIPGPSPRLSLHLTSTKNDPEEQSHDQNHNSNKTQSNSKFNEHSRETELLQTKSEPIKWSHKNREACDDILGAGDSVKERNREEPSYMSGDEENEDGWEDKFFAKSKQEPKPNHYTPQRSHRPALAPEPKEELLDDMTEPELVDDDSLMPTAREPEPRQSKSYTLSGPTVHPSGAASAPCFGGGMMRPPPSTDFGYQHAYQMQYIPGTWFQLPSAPGTDYSSFAGPAISPRGSTLVTKSTSTSDIPYGNSLQFRSRTQLLTRLDSAQRMLREIPEIEIPFTPPAVPKYTTQVSTPMYDRNRLQELESRRSAAPTVWKPIPPPPPQVRKRNVAIQMGVSSLGQDNCVFPRQNVYGHQNFQNTGSSYSHIHSRDTSSQAPASTSQYHQQYLNPQVVVLVPPHEGRNLSKAVSTQSQQQQSHRGSGSGYFK